MHRILIVVLFALFVAAQASAKTADERISELEGRVSSIQQTYLTNNADIAKAISRSETVEQEFAGLKGAVETNTHLLESQRKDLQRMLNDLEHRIQAIEDRMQIFSTQINNAIGKVNPAAADEGKIYQSGLDKAERGEYLNAAADFQTFLKKYPKSTFAPTAQYWIGECFYSMKDYKRAIKEYQFYIQSYPRHEKIAAAILKQGNSFVELGLVEESKPFYEKVIKEYPNSPEAGQANTKLGRLTQKTQASSPSAAGQAPQAHPAGSSAGSYPGQTIEQQRSKYQESATPAKPGGQPAQPASGQQKDQRYIEF